MHSESRSGEINQDGIEVNVKNNRLDLERLGKLNCFSFLFLLNVYSILLILLCVSDAQD